MIDSAEFERGWALLQAAMPETELPDATRELYRHAMARVPAGSFVEGILSLISAPGFDNRRLPSLYEMREEGRSWAAAPLGQRGTRRPAGPRCPRPDLGLTNLGGGVGGATPSVARGDGRAPGRGVMFHMAPPASMTALVAQAEARARRRRWEDLLASQIKALQLPAP